MVDLKICGKHWKKKCFYVFIAYSCLILIIYLVKDEYVNKYESCIALNSNMLDAEKNFSYYVDIKLKTYFERANLIQDSNITKKWIRTASDLYVYSAFLEECPPILKINSLFCIKFIAIVLSNSSSFSPFFSTVKCGIKSSMIIFDETFAIIELLPENHFKLFTAAHVFCPLTKDIIPTHVSVYETPVNITWLLIENYNLFHRFYFNKFNSSISDMQSSDLSHKINICVRPIFSNFSALQLSEFLVYYSVMGIDHFVFYYLKSVKPMMAFLNFLKFSNISYELNFWDIPLNNSLIHEYGQIAFIQDCIARSKYKFRHTAIVDFDEYIVPKAHRDIKSLAVYLDNQYINAGSYVIPMLLFCDEYSVGEFPYFPFHILNHKKRQKTHWQYHYRSKVIVRPERIRYNGIHFTWKLTDNYEEIFVPPSVAVLNHYRACCGMKQTWFFHLFSFKVLRDKVVTDNSLANCQDKFLKHDLIQFIFNVIALKV